MLLWTFNGIWNLMELWKIDGILLGISSGFSRKPTVPQKPNCGSKLSLPHKSINCPIQFLNRSITQESHLIHTYDQNSISQANFAIRFTRFSFSNKCQHKTSFVSCIQPEFSFSIESSHENIALRFTNPDKTCLYYRIQFFFFKFQHKNLFRFTRMTRIQFLNRIFT